MVCQAGFDQWLTTIMPHLPHLSQPQATVLALRSCGMVLARSCALTAGSHWRAKGMKRKEQTGRQQLREWYDDVPRQRGAKRQALHVETCFPGVLGWVVRWWHGTQLALAIDAPALGTRCVVVAVSGVQRGCAIPGAWVVWPANTNHAGRRAWRRRRRRRRPALPRGWPVSVLADRGVQAPWRLRRMVRGGWHPFWRRTTGGSFRPCGAPCWRPLTTCAPRPGTSWRGAGIACARPQVPCTVLARWEDGAKAPWLLLTALAPEASEAGWQGLRAWLAQGLKLTKRAGWPWHRTRMTDPARAARLWLAVAVATWWWRRVGGATDETMPASTLLAVTALCPERPRSRRATRLRLVSVLRQGWVELRVALRRQEPWPEGRLVPEPWPVVPPLAGDPSAPSMVLPEAA